MPVPSNQVYEQKEHTANSVFRKIWGKILCLKGGRFVTDNIIVAATWLHTVNFVIGLSTPLAV